MGFKVRREQAVGLFKFVESLQFRFDPFRVESRALKETWRQMSSPRFLAANPKAKVGVEMKRGGPPSLELVLVDGRRWAVEDASDYTAKDLVTEIQLKAYLLEMEYLETNKPMPTT